LRQFSETKNKKIQAETIKSIEFLIQIHKKNKKSSKINTKE